MQASHFKGITMDITKPTYKVNRHKDGTYTVHTKKGSTLVRKVKGYWKPVGNSYAYYVTLRDAIIAVTFK